MKIQKFVIMPINGFRSFMMERFKSNIEINSSLGGRLPNERHLNILGSIPPDGPVLVELSLSEAKRIKESHQFRVFPVTKYKPAIKRMPPLSNKAASVTKPVGNITISIVDEISGMPVIGAEIFAYIDYTERIGATGKTDKKGFCILGLPEGEPVERLFIYPEHSYWGKYKENIVICNGDRFSVKRIDDFNCDFVRDLYGTPGSGGGGVRVAIIDTGVDDRYNDMRIKKSVTIINAECAESTPPVFGHGSHVAGIVGSNRFGLAPNAELYIYNVFGEFTTATNFDIASAIHMAYQDGCDIINLSLGGGAPNSLISEAIGEAYDHGTVCIVAAGNDNRAPVSFPASFKRTIPVTAIGKVSTFPDDSCEVSDVSTDIAEFDKSIFLSNFTNVGREVDACAPGVGIISYWLKGNLAVKSGTSMACPVVSGIAARLLSESPDLLHAARNMKRSAKVVELIQETCNSLGMPQIYEGFGLPGKE